MQRLSGKIALITGGAGVIGFATANLFLEQGAKVLLVDMNEATLREAIKSIGSDSASHVVANVTEPAEVQNYIQIAKERYGGIDVFVNHASIEGDISPIADYPVETFDKVIAVNVRGSWLGLKYVIPAMAERGGGSIILTSSIAGVKGSARASAYVASKHAIIGIMRTAALECALLNIRVNTVNPSPVESRMMRSLEEGLAPGAPEQAKQLLLGRIPFKRYGTPKEVAQLILFLASDESRFCTGGVYMVDGGSSAA